MAQVLAGVRVVEHGTFITGPAAAMPPGVRAAFCQAAGAFPAPATSQFSGLRPDSAVDDPLPERRL